MAIENAHATSPKLSAAPLIGNGDRVNVNATSLELSTNPLVGNGDRVDVSYIVVIAAPNTSLKTSSVLKLP